MADENAPYANRPFDRGRQATQDRLAADARQGVGQVAAYIGPNGTPLALHGDENGVFVRVLYSPPGIYQTSLVPTTNTVAALLASVIDGALHEAWITDSRDNSTSQPQRWILLFDANKVPNGGTAPSFAPIALCTGGTTDLSFIEAPLGFSTGLVIAISSTANTYTAITAADYAITARVINQGP